MKLSVVLGSLAARERRTLLAFSVFRVLLVFLDLAGLALVGIAVSLLSGTVASEGSATGNLVSWLRDFGIQNAYAAIAVSAVIFFSVKGLTAVVLNNAMAHMLAESEARHSDELIARILRGDLGSLEKFGAGEMPLGIIHSMQMLYRVLFSSLSQLAGELALVALISVYLAWQNLTLFVFFALYFALFTLVIGAFVTSRARKLAQAHDRSWRTSTKQVNQIMKNFRFLKLSANRGFVLHQLSSSRREYALVSAKLGNLSVTPRYVTEFALMLGLCGLVIFQSVSQDTAISAATLAVFIAGAFRIVASLLAAQGFHASILQALEQGALAFDLEALYGSNLSHDNYVQEKAETKPVAVEFTSVSYSSNHSDTPILEGLTFKIAPGEIVAIEGKSGAGKTTLADLMLGLRHPSSGTVNLDGVPIADYLASNQGRLAYMPQEAAVFEGTLSQNISLDTGKIHDEELVRAASQANLDDFIAQSHLGINRQVDEATAGLSGGQKQRISLARVLYQRPGLIVLDEPTSALDRGTRDQILRALANIRGQATMVIISHDKEVLALADSRLVLSAGRLTHVC